MTAATQNTKSSTDFIKAAMQNLKLAAESIDSDGAANYVDIAEILLVQVAEVESMREFEKFTGLVFLKGQINAIDKMIRRVTVNTSHHDQSDIETWSAVNRLSDRWNEFFLAVDNA